MSFVINADSLEHLKTYSVEINDLEREITLFHANAVNEILESSKIEVDFLDAKDSF